MKCKHCNGKGRILEPFGNRTIPAGCPICGGTGEVNALTNEKWMKALDTETFAEAIFAFMDAVNHQNTGEHITNKNEIIDQVILRWLKEKHE